MPHRPRVLVVDDNPVTQDALCAVLAQYGINAEHAGNGYGARTTLEWFRPHAIVLDLVMPGLDGFGFLKELRSGEHRDTPVVIATAASRAEMEEALAEALALGGGPTTGMQKPFDPQELVHVLRGMTHQPRSAT